MDPRSSAETEPDLSVATELRCRKQEQEKLSGVVKSVHRKLRRKYIEVGDFEKIWREHCEDEQTLSEYAMAMKNLADNHWANKCEGEGRIEWCRSVCQEYFQDGGMRRVLEKDEKSARHAEAGNNTSANSPPQSSSSSSTFQLGRIRLLDVGSCFNPFLKFDEFLTVGIDIVPAVETSETESSNIIHFEAEHNTSVIKEMEEIHKMKNAESLEEQEGNGNRIKQMEKQKQDNKEKDQEPEEQEGAEEKHESNGGINSIEDELKYIDDEEDLDAMASEKEEKQQADEDDLLSLEQDSEEQKQIISTSTVESLPHRIDLKDTEYSEKEHIHVNLGLEICEETAASWRESSQKSDMELSGSMQAMENDWNRFEFIDKEENVSYEGMKSDWKTLDDVNNMLENMESLAKDRDLENVEDNTSTESQTDDEMELYLNSLKNSQQSVFRESAMSGSYCKRPSLSRGRPLAMPSISESMDEDQLNSSLEDSTNMEYNMDLERATLPLVDGNEHVIGCNVLWWKEFLSYDNMLRVTGYTFLLVVFLVAAYYYDFIACFALYIITVYWLFRQGEEEPLKTSRKGERGLQ